MKAGIRGLDGPDGVVSTKKYLRSTIGAALGDSSGDGGSGASGGGIHFIPVGAPGAEFHFFSSSVPLKKAGIGGPSFAPGTHFLSWSATAGAFPEGVAFSCGLTGALGN